MHQGRDEALAKTSKTSPLTGGLSQLDENDRYNQQQAQGEYQCDEDNLTHGQRSAIAIPRSRSRP